MKTLLGVCPSLTRESTNSRLLEYLGNRANQAGFDFERYPDLRDLPHFQPEVEDEQPPASVIAWRQKIAACDGVVICTPEYVFSIPALLKNALEWTVSTTVFLHKPVAIFTASSVGTKGHESLQLVMKTLCGEWDEANGLLISGAKAKLKFPLEAADPILVKRIQGTLDHFLESVSTGILRRIAGLNANLQD